MTLQGDSQALFILVECVIKNRSNYHSDVNVFITSLPGTLSLNYSINNNREFPRISSLDVSFQRKDFLVVWNI